jgi:hypothetical protein
MNALLGDRSLLPGWTTVNSVRPWPRRGPTRQKTSPSTFRASSARQIALRARLRTSPRRSSGPGTRGNPLRHQGSSLHARGSAACARGSGHRRGAAPGLEGKADCLERNAREYEKPGKKLHAQASGPRAPGSIASHDGRRRWLGTRPTGSRPGAHRPPAVRGARPGVRRPSGRRPPPTVGQVSRALRSHSTSQGRQRPCPASVAA